MTRRRWQDGTSVLLGGWLLLSPLALGLEGTAAMLTMVAGGGVVLAALWALANPCGRTALWHLLFLAAGYFSAPMFVGSGTGFPPLAAASAWGTSLALGALAWTSLVRARQMATPARAQSPSRARRTPQQPSAASADSSTEPPCPGETAQPVSVS